MKRLLILSVSAALAAGSLSAQTVPLHFGITNPVVDEFGQLLEGSAASPGDLVQILGGNKGIFPPDTNGIPHPDNPLIFTARIGEGTKLSAGPLGRVSGTVGSLADRGSPNNTNTIFARIFNAPVAENASFYTDSQLFEVPVFGDLYDVFFIEASATEAAVDENDDDGDGLNNSWERSYNTDRGNPDSDDDGMLDGHEILAGTDANNETSLLMMVELMPAPGGNLGIQWDAVAGKTYQLEYTTNALSDLVSFEPVNPPVTADGPVASTVVTNGTVPEIGTSFRVRLVIP